MMTGVPGSRAIWRAAESPSRPGISMSIRTRSGKRPAADVDRVVAVVDDRDHVVAQGIELALEAGGHRLFVVGDEDL